MAEPILEVRDLVVRYRRRGLFAAPPPPAVNAASFTLLRGQTLGIVGESGSGKSSLLRAILRLVPTESGAIHLDGRDWLSQSGAELQVARRGVRTRHTGRQ